jgi:hypothetical protein
MTENESERNFWELTVCSGVAWALIRSCIPEHWPACFWASPNWARKLAEDQHHLHDEQPVMAKALMNDSFQSEKCQNDRCELLSQWIIITKTSLFNHNGVKWNNGVKLVKIYTMHNRWRQRHWHLILFSLWNEKVRCELFYHQKISCETADRGKNSVKWQRDILINYGE